MKSNEPSSGAAIGKVMSLFQNYLAQYLGCSSSDIRCQWKLSGEDILITVFSKDGANLCSIAVKKSDVVHFAISFGGSSYKLSSLAAINEQLAKKVVEVFNGNA